MKVLKRDLGFYQSRERKLYKSSRCLGNLVFARIKNLATFVDLVYIFEKINKKGVEVALKVVKILEEEGFRIHLECVQKRERRIQLESEGLCSQPLTNQT